MLIKVLPFILFIWSIISTVNALGKLCVASRNCPFGQECQAANRPGLISAEHCNVDAKCFCIFSYPYLCLASTECALGSSCISFAPPNVEDRVGYCLPCKRTSSSSWGIRFWKMDTANASTCSASPIDAHASSSSPTEFQECQEEDNSSINNCDTFVSPPPACVYILNSGEARSLCTKPQTDIYGDCFCLASTLPCNSSAFCGNGEACVKFRSISDYSYCAKCSSLDRLSPAPIPIDNGCSRNSSSDSPGDSESSDIVDDNNDDEPCIAMDAIKHLPLNQLVFPHHIRSSVLCDNYGNCASAGHMVMFNGRPMMMMSYCKEIKEGCLKTVKLVNNPRMVRSRRIASKVAHLQYTVFSAKYRTFVEEFALKMFLRLGI